MDSIVVKHCSDSTRTNPTTKSIAPVAVKKQPQNAEPKRTVTVSIAYLYRRNSGSVSARFTPDRYFIAVEMNDGIKIDAM